MYFVAKVKEKIMAKIGNVLGLVIVVAAFTGCASGPRLTPEQVEAQIVWEAANPQYSSAGDFRLNVSNDGVIITGYTGAAMDVRIPPQMYGMRVIGIANGAFGRLGLTSVTIPEGVTFIGRSGSLWGPGAFEGNRLRSIVIPESVTVIGIRAFAYNLLTSVEIPDGVALVALEAFFGNRIASIDFPDNARVGSRILGARVAGETSGTMGTPYYVTWVRSSTGRSWINLLGEGDGLVANVVPGDGTAMLITGSTGHSAVIEIPEEINGLPVVAIGGQVADGGRITYNNAFRGSGITSVSIPDGVTYIGRQAFAFNNLSNINIPNSVRTIGTEAFMRNQLTNVTISSSVRTIPDRTFAENQLAEVVIPDGVSSIGNYAFAQNELVSVTIPGSASLIAIRAFANNQLTTVDIPSSVHTIMNGAFANNRLASVNIPSNVRTLDSNAFANNPLTSIVIGDGIGSIHESVFSGSFRDVTQISIGANVNLQGNNEIVWRVFRAAYEANGARAGVYTLRDGQWDWHPL